MNDKPISKKIKQKKGKLLLSAEINNCPPELIYKIEKVIMDFYGI